MHFRLLVALICCSFPGTIFSQAPVAILNTNTTSAIVKVDMVDETGMLQQSFPGCIISSNGDIVTLKSNLSPKMFLRITNADGTFTSVRIEQQSAVNQSLGYLKLAASNKAVNSVLPVQQMPDTGEIVYIVNSASAVPLAAKVIKPASATFRQISIRPDRPLSKSCNGAAVLSRSGQLVGLLSAEPSSIESAYIVLPVIEPPQHNSDNAYLKIETPVEEQPASMDSPASKEFFMGLFALTNTDYNKALLHFKKVIEIDSCNSDAWFQLGYCANKLAHYQEAAKAFEVYIHFSPDNPEAFYNLGVVYTHLENYQPAIQYFKRCIILNKNYVKAYYNLAVVYNRLANYSDAIDFFHKVLELQPDYAEAYFGMGLSYGHINQHQKAIDAFEHALALRPDYVEAMIGLGLLKSSSPNNAAQ
ncbi:tetratricopeptide repeat protein [candidate division KSB1 bacterium]|nr:tetratricopeptide repeat protein [candidate division KSB1 bacterium]